MIRIVQLLAVTAALVCGQCAAAPAANDAQPGMSPPSGSRPIARPPPRPLRPPNSKPAEPAEKWRYRWHNGRWWYWTASNHWLYWSQPQGWIAFQTTAAPMPAARPPVKAPTHRRRVALGLGPGESLRSPSARPTARQPHSFPKNM